MIPMLLAGYYGHGNIGDELVLRSFVHWLKAETSDVRITVLSAAPAETASALDVRSVHRFSVRALYEIYMSGILVLAGGSLIQDTTSARSAIYYLSMIAVARLFRRPVALVCQGFGPLRRGWIRWLAASLLSRVQYISVRDSGSMQTLECLGVPHDRIQYGADLGFIYSEGESAGEADMRRRSSGQLSSGRRILVVWRSGQDDLASARCLEHLLEALQRHLDGPRVTFAWFHPTEDGALSRLLGNSRAESVMVRRVDDAYALIRDSAVVVGMRLHALVIAVSQGIPCVASSYDPKVESFASEARIPCVRWRSEDPLQVAQEMARAVANTLSEGVEVSRRLERVSTDMAHRARSSLAPLRDLLLLGGHRLELG